MTEEDWLAERFQEHRSHLRTVAYRMLGSLTEADDAVQEAWLLLSRSDTRSVVNLGGWLTTVVGRVCLHMLRARRSRGERPLGVHMPDPVVSGSDSIDPENQALLADSVGLALLVVLDPDVILRADGGSLRPRSNVLLRGAPTVAAQALMFARLTPYVRPALINGTAGVVVAPHGRPYSVIAFTLNAGKIVAIDALADPERLGELDLSVLGG